VRSWLFGCCGDETKYLAKVSVEREMRSAVSNTTQHFVLQQASWLIALTLQWWK